MRILAAQLHAIQKAELSTVAQPPDRAAWTAPIPKIPHLDNLPIPTNVHIIEMKGTVGVEFVTHYVVN